MSEKEIVDKVHGIMKDQNVNVTRAIELSGIGKDTYYKAKRKTKAEKEPIKRRRRRTSALLKVSDLPMVASDQGKLFMVFGSPELLSQFARGLQ